MKRFILLFLLSGLLFPAVSTSTFTVVSANAVYYVSTEFGAGVRSNYIGLYIEYTKGDESSVDVTLNWLPNYTWAGTSYYAVGERANDETMQPVTLKFDTTGKTMYKIGVPAGASRLYIVIAYQSGSTGTFKMNHVNER
jgi:hypothetical protein